MLKRYTFLKHPFYFVLQNSKQLIGGLDKCIGVFCSSSNELEVIAFDNQFLHINTEKLFIPDLRKSKTKVNWIKPDQVPFEIEKSNVEQLSFEDEESSSVLELRFLNPYDNNADVLYFYFKNNIGNFKLANTNDSMAVTVKEVIQNLLYNQLLLMLQANYDNAIIHKKIASSIDNSILQNKIESLEEEKFKQANDAYNYLLTNITNSETTEFVLSKPAINKLLSFNLSLNAIHSVLKASLEILINKYPLGSFYELSEFDIVANINDEHIEMSVKEQNLTKTASFLDKYESAAKISLSKNEKITGLNIGNNCYPAISPAAISDILRKHQNKITLLMAQNPQKWPIIRARFKPILNVIEKSSQNLQARRSA